MTARSISIVTTACFALVIAVAGCSSNSSQNPAAGSTGGSGAPTSASAGAGGGSKLNTSDCSSVPASRVNAALGTSVTGPTANTGGPAVMCQYATGGNPSALIIRIESNSTLDEMNAGRKLGNDNGVPSTDVAGLGDAAYSTAISTPGLPTVTSVDAQKGSLNVQVTAAVAESTIEAFVAQLIG